MSESNRKYYLYVMERPACLLQNGEWVDNVILPDYNCWLEVRGATVTPAQGEHLKTLGFVPYVRNRDYDYCDERGNNYEWVFGNTLSYYGLLRMLHYYKSESVKQAYENWRDGLDGSYGAYFLKHGAIA